jgi:hypothetical protein
MHILKVLESASSPRNPTRFTLNLRQLEHSRITSQSMESNRTPVTPFPPRKISVGMMVGKSGSDVMESNPRKDFILQLHHVEAFDWCFLLIYICDSRTYIRAILGRPRKLKR